MADQAQQHPHRLNPQQLDGRQPAARKPGLRKPDDDPVGKVYDSRLMRRLGHYLLPYWWQAAVSSVAVSLKSLSDVAGPYLVKVAIDRYMTGNPGPATNWLTRRLPADPFTGITRLAEIYVVALVSAYFFEFIQTYLMQWTGQKIMFDLRRDIFRHMQRMHIGFFDTHAVGRLVTRITSDVDAINEMFTGGILAIVDDFFTLTIMAIVMLSINWWLALLAFAVLPLILVVTRLFRDHVRESYRRVRAAIARINSFTQEHISGMSVVQLFNREQRAYNDFEDVNRLHMIAFKDTIFAYALYYPAVELLSAVGHRARHLARRIRRHLRLGHHRRARHVHPVFAALLAPHSGSERQVQHPASRHGRLRTHLQAPRYSAGDRQPRQSASRRRQQPDRVPPRLVHLSEADPGPTVHGQPRRELLKTAPRSCLPSRMSSGF